MNILGSVNVDQCLSVAVAGWPAQKTNPGHWSGLDSPHHSQTVSGIILTNIRKCLFFLTTCACLVCRLVMPLVCKDMVDILDVGVNSTSANHTSLSNFAFLYGVFPTAPSVAIYAGHYNMELEVVSTSSD